MTRTPKTFPTIGNFFSNHWKISEFFFQSLENRRIFFPIIGKLGPIFPTIGKKFSNHWKTFALPVFALLLLSGCVDPRVAILSIPEPDRWIVTASSQQAGAPASAAADGNESTEWRADADDSQPWWQADLGRSVHIEGFSLTWGATPALAYTISVSADAVHWSVACEVDDGDGGWDLMAIQPLRARYVRLSVDRRDQTAGTALRDFEVLGLATAPDVFACAAKSRGGKPCPQGIALLQAAPADRGWCCPTASGELTVDFRTVHRFGGVRIDWGEAGWAAVTDIEISTDNTSWQHVGQLRSTGRPVTYMGPGLDARLVRLAFRGGSGPATARDDLPSHGFEVLHLSFRGEEGTYSPANKLQAAAAAAPPGLYPQVLLNRQTYWTSAGTDGAVLGEDGAFAGAPDQPALWPLVLTAGRVHTPSTAPDPAYRLGGRSAGPLPEIRWSAGGDLAVRQRAMPRPDAPGAWQLVEVENRSDSPQQGWLCFVLHPVAIPPGPPAPVKSIAIPDVADSAAPRTLLVNRTPLYTLLAENAALAAGAAPFTDEGDAVRYLDPAAPRWPSTTSASSTRGLASGLCGLDFNLQPGARARVLVWTGRPPDGTTAAAFPPFESAWDEACWNWMNRTRGLDPRIDRMDPMDALRAQTGWLLIPPTDSEPLGTLALRVAALLRAGETDAARDWVRAVAGAIGEDGCPPSALYAGQPDPAADPAPPGEAEGQFAWILGETARYTGDTAFLTDHYPALRRVLSRLSRLRNEERKRQSAATGFFARTRRSIPTSLPLGTDAAPHDGPRPPDPAGHPRYAPNLWALLAWREGLSAAATLGLDDDTAWITSELASLRDALRTSLRAATAAMPAPGIPESAERPTPSLRTALLLSWPCDFPDLAPTWALQSTLDAWYATFLDRFDAPSSTSSPAGEPLLSIPYARLGRGDYAREILYMRLEHRYPPGWHTWPAAIAPDSRRRTETGPMPDPRAAAAWLLACRTLIADERGPRLDLLQGPPMEWLQYGDGLTVEHLPTPFGPLDLHAYWNEDQFTVEIGGQARPPAGYRVRWPLTGLPDRVTLNGVPVTDFDPTGILLPHDFRGTPSAPPPHLPPRPPGPATPDPSVSPFWGLGGLPPSLAPPPSKPHRSLAGRPPCRPFPSRRPLPARTAGQTASPMLRNPSVAFTNRTGRNR